ARAGFSFQSHSRTHPDLMTLPRPLLVEELAGARRDIEDLLGHTVSYLAYPYGRFDETVVEVTRACGYSAAFCTQAGFNRTDADPFRIRRLEIYGTDTARTLLRKVGLGSNDGSWWHSMRYYRERMAARLR